jgi:hypothetical protein
MSIRKVQTCCDNKNKLIKVLVTTSEPLFSSCHLLHSVAGENIAMILSVELRLKVVEIFSCDFLHKLGKVGK